MKSFLREALLLREKNDCSLEFDIFLYELIICAIENTKNLESKQGESLSFIRYL